MACWKPALRKATLVCGRAHHPRRPVSSGWELTTLSFTLGAVSIQAPALRGPHRRCPSGAVQRRRRPHGPPRSSTENGSKHGSREESKGLARKMHKSILVSLASTGAHQHFSLLRMYSTILGRVQGFQGFQATRNFALCICSMPD